MDTPPLHREPAYRRALFVSALLNFAMLGIEMGVGVWIGSAALVADAADFLEDGVVLSLALIAVAWSARSRATAGLLQGLAMSIVGLTAAAQIVYRLVRGGLPSPAPMGAVAALALSVNTYCAYRLVRFRRGDSSMRAIWLSTRNDALLNILTIAAAGAITLTRSPWPDLAAGAIISAVNLWASVEVMRTARRELLASGTE